MAARLIRSPADLVTSHKAVCEGFLSQAVKKTERANPYVREAKQLYDALKSYHRIDRLANAEKLRLHLLAAAGFSDKARAHLSTDELSAALARVLALIADKAGSAWREEIIYRYLLTAGDSLGGAMRNVTGAMAATQLSASILASLKKKGIKPELRAASANPEKIQAMLWPGRILLFDKTPAFLDKNVDVILLRVPSATVVPTPNSQANYVACGELKGGIDPAGADEHWKTARSALERIRTAFGKNVPALFFVGAAIQKAMAEEIFSHLKNGTLSHAANLTKHDQVADLTDWLVTL